MKAITLKEFGQFDVTTIADPSPREDDVVIRIVATGICGSDIHGFTGDNGRRHPGQVMGHESVGRVDQVGEKVSGLSIGDVVTFNPVIIPAEDMAEYDGREQQNPRKKVMGVTPDIVSSFAELVVVPQRNVVKLPQDLPITLGALIEPLAVAVHAVRRAGAESDDRVLVLGGGPIGQSVVLALQMVGVTDIVVSELSASRRELVESLGVRTVDAADSDVTTAIEERLGGLADVVIDAVGINPTLDTALKASRFGATICLVGMGAPRVEIDAYGISTGERQLVGSFTYSAQDFRDAAEWIGSSSDNAAQLISGEVPPEEAQDAFVKLADHADIPGKILIRFDN